MEDVVSERVQPAEVLHAVAVVLHRSAGHAVQLLGVGQTDADAVDVDALCPRLLSLGDGSARVDVGHAVSDDNGHVGHARPVPVGRCEHLRPHGQQGVCSVGAALTVRHAVNGSIQARPVAVGVQMELQVVVVAEGDYTHTHAAVVNAGFRQEVDQEILHHLEVELRHAGGRVQHKHHVHLGATVCNRYKNNIYNLSDFNKNV